VTVGGHRNPFTGQWVMSELGKFWTRIRVSFVWFSLSWVRGAGIVKVMDFTTVK
jgi:hypothetical protein